jgi:hypothetical protein
VAISRMARTDVRHLFMPVVPAGPSGRYELLPQIEKIKPALPFEGRFRPPLHSSTHDGW